MNRYASFWVHCRFCGSTKSQKLSQLLFKKKQNCFPSVDARWCRTVAYVVISEIALRPVLSAPPPRLELGWGGQKSWPPPPLPTRPEREALVRAIPKVLRNPPRIKLPPPRLFTLAQSAVWAISARRRFNRKHWRPIASTVHTYCLRQGMSFSVFAVRATVSMILHRKPSFSAHNATGRSTTVFLSKDHSPFKLVSSQFRCFPDT